VVLIGTVASCERRTVGKASREIDCLRIHDPGGMEYLDIQADVGAIPSSALNEGTRVLFEVTPEVLFGSVVCKFVRAVKSEDVLSRLKG